MHNARTNNSIWNEEFYIKMAESESNDSVAKFRNIFFRNYKFRIKMFEKKKIRNIIFRIKKITKKKFR